MNKTDRIYSTILAMVLLIASPFIGFRIDSNKAPKGDVPVNKPMVFQAVKDVKVNDPFWSPKLKLWSDITVNDIFNKFDGLYDAESRRDLLNDYKKLGRTRDAFHNFDLVAKGKRGVGQQQHEGPPWYDGLVYETIREAGDFLIQYPDKKTEERIDAYIDRSKLYKNLSIFKHFKTRSEST